MDVSIFRISQSRSAGFALGELIAAFAAMHRVNGQIKLLHLHDRLNELLITTKLITIFETFDSESSAISSFSAGQVSSSL